jgi:hypothetical protein
MSTEENENKPVYVNSTEQFIELLMGWHANKVKELEHMLDAPEGIQIAFNEEPPQVLSGDLHKGFIMGVTLGLMQLGILPFHAEGTPPPDSEGVAANEPVVH